MFLPTGGYAAAAKSLQSCPTLRPWDFRGKNNGVGCHFLLQHMKVKSESEVTQLCPTLSDPIDCSLPGSSVHGISQARILEWVAISSTRGFLQPRDRTYVSCIGDSLPLLCGSMLLLLLLLLSRFSRVRLCVTP